MRKPDMDFLVDGEPMLLSDEDVTLSFQDLDSEASGRDESGVMHRSRLRSFVGTWGFSYSHLTGEEYAYLMERLGCKPVFAFTYSAPGGSRTVNAYCAKMSATIQNRATGSYKDCSFQIIEC